MTASRPASPPALTLVAADGQAPARPVTRPPQGGAVPPSRWAAAGIRHMHSDTEADVLYLMAVRSGWDELAARCPARSYLRERAFLRVQRARGAARPGHLTVARGDAS